MSSKAEKNQETEYINFMLPFLERKISRDKILYRETETHAQVRCK